MILTFSDQATADVFAERSSRAARTLPVGLWPTIRRKLKWLDVAHRLSDLASPPGNRLEALKSDQRGRHSIRVNDQFRLTFRWEGSDAHEVRCEDYHA
jgi:proteic killer suppression protein